MPSEKVSQRGTPGKEAEPGRGGDRPVGGKKPPGPGQPSKTKERPKQPKCTCQTTADVYTQIGSLRPVSGRPLRIHVNVRSVVVCDPATPDHCYYRYIAAAEVQRFRPRRGKRPAKWEAYPNRRAFIQLFTVHDDVNKTERPDRIDQVSLELGEWYPKAPEKEATRITLELAGSIRGGWRTTINRTLVLCVPKLDDPECPEK